MLSQIELEAQKLPAVGFAVAGQRSDFYNVADSDEVHPTRLDCLPHLCVRLVSFCNPDTHRTQRPEHMASSKQLLKLYRGETPLQRESPRLWKECIIPPEGGDTYNK